MRQHEGNTPHRRAVDQVALRKIGSLSRQQRHRLITVLALLIGADEALADTHLGLTCVAVDLYLLDGPYQQVLSYTPRELLRLTQSAQNDDDFDSDAHLVIDC